AVRPAVVAAAAASMTWTLAFPPAYCAPLESTWAMTYDFWAQQFPITWRSGRDATLCGGMEDYPCPGFHEQCPPDTPWQSSAPGRSIAAVRTDNPGRVLFTSGTPQDWRDGTTMEPQCLTFDHLPIGTAAEVRTKYVKLKATWDDNEASLYPVDRP